MAVAAGHVLVAQEIGCLPSGGHPIATPSCRARDAVLVDAGRRMTEKDAVDGGSAGVVVSATMRAVPATIRADFMSVSVISTNRVRPVCTISLPDDGTIVSSCPVSCPIRMRQAENGRLTPKEASLALVAMASAIAAVMPNAREGSEVPVLGRTGHAVAVKV